MTISTLFNVKNLKRFSFLSFFAVLSSTVIAGSGGDAFQGVFDDLAAFADGVPGQIIAFMTVAGVLMFSVVRPNLIGLGASILIMVVLAQLNTIITSMLTAGLPI
ncbi:hypothetical protein L0B53_18735 (plasmid) [Vibrio sp. SS-MA-C1-2]|uniref:hypothetical protein n=1 Tax=Vibrio sp. SS-MA-C1-2 TaxID=2908646 RepID=UPI001F3DD6E6|nr:hypothetical protein [Vibrio sp. SS-MA-C1-2]UJF20358.1 hypothetical protein L0B53_18735 [Vibrio sp. SS-MA-C1-2]